MTWEGDFFFFLPLLLSSKCRTRLYDYLESMRVVNDAWNEILLSSAQWIFRVLLYDRYILCCSDRAETPPTAAAALPCTPAWILCQRSCHQELLLFSLLQAHTSGRQLNSFSQGVNSIFHVVVPAYGNNKKSNGPYRISKQPHIIWDLRNSGLIICRWLSSFLPF